MVRKLSKSRSLHDVKRNCNENYQVRHKIPFCNCTVWKVHMWATVWNARGGYLLPKQRMSGLVVCEDLGFGPEEGPHGRGGVKAS